MPTERDAPRCETCDDRRYLTGPGNEGKFCPACAARPPVEGLREAAWQEGFDAGSNVIQDGPTADEWIALLRAAEAERDALREALDAIIAAERTMVIAGIGAGTYKRHVQPAIAAAIRATRSGGEGAQGG